MGDFEIRIGMSTDTIMKNIDKFPQVTERTRELIQNFCQYDHDQKITTNVELAMLQSWLNGSEKVQMPEEPNTKSEPIGRRGLFADYKRYKTHKAITTIFHHTGKYDAANINSITDCVRNKHKLNIDDTLIDANNDGYADNRHTTYYTKGVPIYLYDKNIDGRYEEPTFY